MIGFPQSLFLQEIQEAIVDLKMRQPFFTVPAEQNPWWYIMKSTTRFWSGSYYIDLRHFIEITSLCYIAIRGWTGSVVTLEDLLVYLYLIKDQQRSDNLFCSVF